MAKGGHARSASTGRYVTKATCGLPGSFRLFGKQQLRETAVSQDCAFLGLEMRAWSVIARFGRGGREV
jgi:hypothetical protein